MVREQSVLHLQRDLDIAWDLLVAAVTDVHCVYVQSADSHLCVPRTPIDLKQQLPIWMKRIKHINEIDHLSRGSTGAQGAVERQREHGARRR
eukprot:6753735-Prymnesium_polylepis.3